MPQKLKEHYNRKRKIGDAKDISWREVFKHAGINFLYGVVASGIPTAIALDNRLAVLFSSLAYYSFLSVILNRPPYKTKIGKRLFVVSCGFGLYLGWELTKLILN